MWRPLYKDYRKLTKLLCWVFCRLKHPMPERVLASVMYAAMWWDVSPSDINNIMDACLEEMHE